MYLDELVFIERYVKIINPFNGLSPLCLTDNQVTLLEGIHGKDAVFDAIDERQTGATTALAAHALWTTLYYPDQCIVMMGARNSDAVGLRTMFKTMFDNLPDAFKETLVVDNVHRIKLTNGSSVHFMNSNPDNLNGLTTTLLIADTFEFFKPIHRTQLYNRCDSHGFSLATLVV